MLLKREILDGILAGEITLAFRRWKRPTVKSGGQLKTQVGVLEIREVTAVDPEKITAAQAHQAGFATLADLHVELGKRSGETYRITLGYAGVDPRIALRERVLDDADFADIRAKLGRTDKASRGGAWTTRVLELIEAQPARRAPELAAQLALETAPFKQRVRRLKALGLTESLAVGYRLSPRGQSYLARLRAGD